MASRITKIACAAALLAPLAVANPASAWDGPSENDCNQPYGAVTKHPAPNRDCVGLDLHDGDFPGHNAPAAPAPLGYYQVYIDATFAAYCEEGDTAVDGGWFDGNTAVRAGGPTSLNGLSGWTTAGVANADDVFVICADFAPAQA